MYFLYSLLGALALIALSPYFLYKGLRDGKYLGSLRQRMGALPPELLQCAEARPHGIWLHAVSVGEVLAAVPLVESLRISRPELPIWISTTTETGQSIACERLTEVDGVFYFPIDFAFVVRRFLRSLSPSVIVIMETEIWPNLLREAQRQCVPVIFANARISDRSLRRYRLTNRFFNRFVADAVDRSVLLLAQSPEDAERLTELGADESHVEVTGNLKYDLVPPQRGAFAEWLKEEIQRQERWPIVVAGSVAAEEEEAVLAAYDIVQRQWRHALLILAPRKTFRFDEAAEIVERDGWNVVRRSAVAFDKPLAENAEVLLLDTIGELAGLYGLADAVFVGGSLVPRGGHNILEPAFFGRAPLFGPHMESFREMASRFLAARAAIQVRSGEELGHAWVRLIQDENLCAQMGEAARGLLARHRGATERVSERILDVLTEREATR